jgi:hypothetical protein
MCQRRKILTSNALDYEATAQSFLSKPGTRHRPVRKCQRGCCGQSNWIIGGNFASTGCWCAHGLLAGCPSRLRRQLRIPAILPLLVTKENHALVVAGVPRVARQRIPANSFAEKPEPAKCSVAKILALFGDTLNIGSLGRYLHSL